MVLPRDYPILSTIFRTLEEFMAPAKKREWPAIFGSQKNAVIASGLSGDKLKQLRDDRILAERIYWIRIPGSTHILWNIPLVLDWLVNGSECPAHQRAVESFIASLPSSEAA
jgi:hypothetical protein